MNANDKQDSGDADRAAELTDRAGGYDADQYPEEPGSATPPVDEETSEPPRSD